MAGQRVVFGDAVRVGLQGHPAKLDAVDLGALVEKRQVVHRAVPGRDQVDLVQAVNELGLETSIGELDEDTVEVLVEVLGRATTTPDDVFVAVWEAFGDTPPERLPVRPGSTP